MILWSKWSKFVSWWKYNTAPMCRDCGYVPDDVTLMSKELDLDEMVINAAKVMAMEADNVVRCPSDNNGIKSLNAALQAFYGAIESRRSMLERH
jgi:hypothetical protein